MKTVYLIYSYVVHNCSLLAWCIHPETANKIQKFISKYDTRLITCGNHNYMFSVVPSGNHFAGPFSFNETDMLMELLPNESDSFYLKAALREFMNAFIVFNYKGDRVYPEDII